MSDFFSTIWHQFLHSPFMGIFLSIITYLIGCVLNKKINSPFTGKLFVSVVLCCVFLWVTKTPYELYNSSASIFTTFLSPATAAIAVSMYRELETLKKNIVPIIAGTTVGSIVSIVSIILMCKFFNLDRAVAVGFLPKSVTMSIALGIVEANGGLPAITVACIVYTGNLGAMLAVPMIKLFRVKNRVAAGLAIGTCSHATGSSKAFEIGDLEGATSGLAIGCAGLATVIICSILSTLCQPF